MLKDEIGTFAGTVWLLLNTQNGLSIRELCDATNQSESFIYLALGWLSRENKILLKVKNGKLCIELIQPMNEVYY